MLAVVPSSFVLLAVLKAARVNERTSMFAKSQIVAL